MDAIQVIGILASATLPFFNIPLLARILKRKSAEDFSLSWAVGVWVCIVLMTPQAVRSSDVAFRIFGVVNLIFFSAVTFFILKYKKKS